jgi:hypothetical protein
MTFSVPKQCPHSYPFRCVNSFGQEDSYAQQAAFMSPPAGNMTSSVSGQQKRKHSKAPLVVSDVRRSERINKVNYGFKASFENAKPCLCCDADPLTLSSKVIKDHGKDFYKMNVKMLIYEGFKKKPHVKKAVVKK